jgi:adenosylcobyric acid synthase
MNGKAKVVMVMGTASDVGKSVVATALCRILTQDGWQVAPFKAQNMSLNSFAVPDGGEIGRAQVVQVEAARVTPTVDVNPVLLKPVADHRSQVPVLGTPMVMKSAAEYYEMKPKLWPVVTGALDRLRDEYDVAVIEGAGSPAEINLKAQEIVNMSVAKYADAAVILVGDIERGGVFASLVGTMALLDDEECPLIKGFLINKFRGDPGLLTSGLEMLEERTGVPVLSMLPHFVDIQIPQEDSLGIDAGAESAGTPVLDIAVMRLPNMANFDDFDPLRAEPGVAVRYVSEAEGLGSPELMVIPGSKTTVEDLAWLRKKGLDVAITARRKQGMPVIGICGGYQMLGERIMDPEGVESSQAEAVGVGLLPVTTEFGGTKATQQVEGTVNVARGLLADCAGIPIKGYEIHIGTTDGSGLFSLDKRSGTAVDELDGAMDGEGLTLGTYMHGLFHNREFRRGVLGQLAAWKGVELPPGDEVDLEAEYDKLAEIVRANVDIGALYRVTGLAE